MQRNNNNGGHPLGVPETRPRGISRHICTDVTSCVKSTYIVWILFTACKLFTRLLCFYICVAALQRHYRHVSGISTFILSSRYWAESSHILLISCSSSCNWQPLCTVSEYCICIMHYLDESCIVRVKEGWSPARSVLIIFFSIHNYSLWQHMF